ncbi:uncharacterized protein LOC115214241 [Argonauta hians]
MAGRPRAPVIIEANLLSKADIRKEDLTIGTLLPVIEGDPLTVIRWLAARRLLRNTLDCPHCGSPCRFTRYAEGLDGYRWRCNGHKFTKSIRFGSFFEKSHISLKNLVLLIYLWAHDYPQGVIQGETGISSPTVADRCSSHRDVCERFLEENPEKLGGFHDNDEPIVVEVDEINYFHRKYDRGKWPADHWVFAAVERHSGRCCAIEVPDRERQTLLSIIKRWILPGSRIVTDTRQGYTDIGKEVLYQHDVIGDGDDASSWLTAKHNICKHHGPADTSSPSFLSEFLWRNRIRNGNSFSEFIICVSEQYDISTGV